MERSVKAGWIGFGEVNTPRDVLERLTAAALRDVRALGWDVTDAGLVVDDPGYAAADCAAAALRGGEWDLIVLCVAGWIPTHAVIRAIEPYRHVPMAVWGLAGWHEEGRLVSTAGQAGTTGLCFAMRELGYRFIFTYSVPGGSAPADRIDAFARAAMAARRLRSARVGTMGYRDMLLYGTMFDGVSLRRELGVEVEPFEMLEIVRAAGQFGGHQVKDVTDYCLSSWLFEKPADRTLLERGARYYLALERKVRDRGYEAVTLIDVDGMKKLEGFPPAMVFMLLADRTGICTIPENDVMGSVTQLLVRALTGQDAHYMEYYEFFQDRVLIGVPDYIPASAAEGGVRVLPAAFGLLTGSLLNISRVRDGRVTLVRLIHGREGYALHAVTGTAAQPAPWEECGWAAPAPQLPSLEVRLDTPVEEFAQKVASQHAIVAYGDIMEPLSRWAALTGVKMI